jgi:Flp pilus assembly protein protease CpaA
MGIGFSLFLLAVGAILAFAVDARVSGIEIQTVGLILMVIGALGLVLTLLVWGPRRREPVGGGDVVVEERREVVR